VTCEQALQRGRPFSVPPLLAAPGIPPRLLDSRAASAYLSCSGRKLRWWHRRGLVRAVRLDAKLRFELRELDAFVERMKRGEP